MSDPDDPLVGLEPARLLADTDACSALTALVGRLRAMGYDGSAGSASATDAARAEPGARTLVPLARGLAVDRPALIDALGADDVAALRRCGALLVVGGEAILSARIFPMRSVYTVLPFHRDGDDIVYLGADSICLFEIAWAARGFGDRAVDLGTGNGFIAAAFATRYDHVIAADLSARCAATAALVPVLNPHLRGRFSAVQMDVAEGLRPGSFDLVTANAPWVPETEGPDGGAPRRFAAGGPTGFELPRRFIDGAADLLTPGGRAFIACLDIGFGDGGRPLVEHLGAITDRGFDVDVTATRVNDLNDFDVWAAGKAPGATSGRHVVVELRRRA